MEAEPSSASLFLFCRCVLNAALLLCSNVYLCVQGLVKYGVGPGCPGRRASTPAVGCRIPRGQQHAHGCLLQSGEGLPA
eukprot:1160705-Pelagomonas_calceolata.AAC.13